MRGFQVAFGGKNGEFICKILIINMLLEYSKYSKKSVRRTFLSILRIFCIWLIINNLSLTKNFISLSLAKKWLQVLNLHFGRKYHFVKLESDGLACFLLFLSTYIRLYIKQAFPICVFSKRMYHEINFLFTFALANQKNN